MQHFLFTIAMTCITRTLLLRDRVLGRIGWRRGAQFESDSTTLVELQRIASGKNLLEAVFAVPATQPTRAVVLICHGIGEIVDHWVRVQRMLAAQGVASLVFDYSGYGKSTGVIRASQCEEDAVAAYRYLQGLAPGSPIALLGFSLGSGVAAAVAYRVSSYCLMLCAGFTSFRAATRSLGIPKFCALGMPDLWHARDALRDCRLPVLVVHGDRDPLFPVAMATELASHCGPDAELRIIPNLTHNEPFYRPDLAYWGPIVEWLAASAEGSRIPASETSA